MESFAANGIRSKNQLQSTKFKLIKIFLAAILALFLRDSLQYSEDISTAVLHIFNFFGQFCPLLGAILADNYFGNQRLVSVQIIFLKISNPNFVLGQFFTFYLSMDLVILELSH